MFAIPGTQYRSGQDSSDDSGNEVDIPASTQYRQTGQDSSDGSENEDSCDDLRVGENLGFDGEDTDTDDDEIVETEAELMALDKKQLKIKLAERGLLVSGNKSDLIQRILNPQPADYKNKPKRETWKHSKAKALLIRLLRDKSSAIHNMTPDEAYESSGWFKQFPKSRFINNMKNLGEAVEGQAEIVQNDNETIAAELATLRMIGQTSNQEYPIWANHPASCFLEQDLKAGLNEGMLPVEFQQTRPEYCEFPDYVFRKHIYQEQRKQREMPMKIAKRNKIAEKKHHDEAEKEAARWHAEREHDDLVDCMYDLMLG